MKPIDYGDINNWSDFKKGETIKCINIPTEAPYNDGRFTLGKLYNVFVFQGDPKHDRRDWYSIQTDAGDNVIVNHPIFRGCFSTAGVAEAIAAPYITKTKTECECGTGNPRSQGHSDWCKLYTKEF